MQGRFLKSYNLTVKQMGGKKVHKKKSRGREKYEIQTGLTVAILQNQNFTHNFHKNITS